MHRRFWWPVAAALFASILLLGDLRHFTWWATVQYYVYALLSAADLSHRYAVAYVTQAALVITGVCAMSVMRCDLLEDAAVEYGLAYIPLNFCIHYLPLLTVIALPPSLPVPNPSEQAALGVALFALYVATSPSEAVYGCHIPRVWPVLLPLVVLVPLLALKAWPSSSAAGSRTPAPRWQGM